MKGVGQRNCRNDAHQGIGRNFVWAAPEFGDGRGIDGPGLGLGRDSGGDQTSRLLSSAASPKAAAR